MADDPWNDMLSEFRALGGTADNICMREGANGRGIFPIDPAKPVFLRVPETLLIDAADVHFEHGKLRTGSNAKIGLREHMFVENYMNTISWVGGRREIELVFEHAQELPRGLRETLKAEVCLGDWFEVPTDKRVQQCFVDSRKVFYRSRVVLMPIVELLNHSPSGQHFELERGIAIKGVFDGEITARYSETDALGIFSSWGFACEQPQAFSFPLKSSRPDLTIQIGRDLTSLSQKKQFWAPKLSAAENGVTLEFLMLGNKRFPRTNKGIFYKLMREAGIKNYEESFDLIQNANLTRISNLFALVEKAEGVMAQTLRQVARYQLQALAYCMGVREV